MEGPRVVLLVLLLFFVFLSPDTQRASPRQRAELGRRADEYQQALGVLRNSSYGELDVHRGRWINTTGLRQSEGYEWDLLPEAQRLARDQLLELHGPVNHGGNQEEQYKHAAREPTAYYQNISGTINGKFLRQKLPSKQNAINLTALIPNNDYIVQEFTRNMTEVDGEIRLHLNEAGEQHGGTVNKISAHVIVLTESSPGSGWQMKLHGYHFMQSGAVVLTTTSEKFAGIFTLPHFTLSEDDFHTLKVPLNESITRTLSEWNVENDPAIPWSSSMNDAAAALFPLPGCEYIIYLQQRPVQSLGQNSDAFKLIHQLEKELREPDGAPIPIPPPMGFSAIVFSPDCGIILESSYLAGPKTEMFWILVRRLLIAMILILGMQLALLKRQMDEASTPSTRSRISYQSIGIMAMGDGLVLAGFIGFVSIEDSAFLMLSALAFLSCLNVAFFEMKFIHEIWTVQDGEQSRHQQRNGQQPGGASQPTDSTSAPRHDNNAESPGTRPGLPSAVTGQRIVDTGATPIILPPDQDLDAAEIDDERASAQRSTQPIPQQRSQRAEFTALYTRFYFTLLIFIFLSVWATSWPRPLRSVYVNMLSFAYLTFWTPQIYRNIMRNCRQALSWEYVLGSSILRLIPIVYCYTKENNVFYMNTDTATALILIAWVWVQVLALASQAFLGPRLLVKESWCPPAYDYHPILRDDADVEAGAMLPIGLVASASEAQDKDDRALDRDYKSRRKIFDCAICMNEIDVPVISKDDRAERSGQGGTWLERRKYMVTPCRHIFHSECLEGWMRLRLVCPICREGLPPI